MHTLQQKIFKKSSKTFYYSTLFFPKHTQTDVHKLYAFVRTADDFVDSLEQNWTGFYHFRDESLYFIDSHDEQSSHPIISWFVEVYKKYHFKREWVVSFLSAMESDLWVVRMKDTQELESYMYGSAAVVGYMMCAIFSIQDQQRLEAAKMFAYSLQTINFIRDIDEDNKLWRRYLYNTYLSNYDGLIECDTHFSLFCLEHMQHYYSYLKAAKQWLAELPLHFRIAVVTASDIYTWTAREIEKNPARVFQEKIKPSIFRVMIYGLSNSIIESTKSSLRSIKKLY